MTDWIAHFLPRRLLPTALLFALICLHLMCLPLTGTMAAHAAGQVNVYSYRQPMLVKPLFDRFTQETGIKVKVIYAAKGLIERIAIEGERSPADILLTTDIGRLSQAAKIAQPVRSAMLNKHIPAIARSRDNLWFGLTWRARIGFASKARVKETKLDYLDLANAKWRGRLCLRSGQHPYNVALFAAMLNHLGENRFRQWLRGVKANLASKPSGNDRAQARKIYAGSCDLALANTYYMGAMQTNEKNPEQKQWAQAVRLIFPTMPGGGHHVNLSGMAMAKHAPNRANALHLMAFLVSKPAQSLYAEVNHEYPIRADVPPSAQVAAWGGLRPDSLAMDDIANHSQRASRIVDEIGFNDGS
jgi:iron(III) transport system substrate-binding protein